MTMTTERKTQDRIREIASRLLSSGAVDGVIGFCRGSLPNMTRPFMARTPDQAEELVFNSHCRLNLAAYLTPDRFRGERGRVAVVAKGCDSRNMVTQIQENRFSRDQVHIIGVPCSGMVDKTSADAPQSNCRTCISPNPVIYDELAAEKKAEPDPGDRRFADVEKIEAMEPSRKAAFFRDLVSACIRCYACRNACPLCYCPTCFVDESRPQWVGKTVDPTDVMSFHLIRAFHDAGRCTDCGACEAACPMGIPVRHFTRKTIRDTVAAFGCETGMDPDTRPPLDRFDLKDPEGFIR